MTETSSLDLSAVPPVPSIGSFWGRLLALGVDLGLLFGVGSLLGWLFGDRLAQWGGWGWLVGFTLVLGYFGLLNSRIGKGQTVGKRLLRIRVVGLEGELIAPGRALLRGAILGALGLLNSSRIDGRMIEGVILGLWLGMIYLYLFNRRTRQSLHDLIVGTCVVRSAGMAPRCLGAVPRRHYLGLSAVVVLGVGWHLGGSLYRPVSDLLTVQEKLRQVEGVYRVQVETGSRYGGSTGQLRYFVASVMLDNPTAAFAQRAAEKIMAAGDPTPLRLPPAVFSAASFPDQPVWMRLCTAYLSWVTARLSPPSLAYFQAVAEGVDGLVQEHYPDSVGRDERVILVNYGYDIGIAPRAYVQVERRWVPFHGIWREESRRGIDFP